MKTLCMDTTHKYLVIGLFDNEKCVSKCNEYAWKGQSEQFFPALLECMKEANWQSDDIDQIVLTNGPGSYTGERIAMTIGKVFAVFKSKKIYTITTFQAYAGNQPKAMVVMDARSHRAYYGIVENGCLLEEGVKPIEELKLIDLPLIGDVDLFDQQLKEIDFAQNMMDVKNAWVEVENIHALVPHYLKSNEELVK